MFGNISIEEMSNLTETPVTLSGKTNNTDNFLNWQTTAKSGIGDYELQKSTDGINFTRLSKVSFETGNKNTAAKVQVYIIE